MLFRKATNAQAFLKVNHSTQFDELDGTCESRLPG